MGDYITDRLLLAARSAPDSLSALLTEAATVISARDTALRTKQSNRSDEEHNLFFGVVGMAFSNWPESHKFQPTDAEHLRAWLLIEANHFEELDATDVTKGDIGGTIKLGLFFCGGRKHFRLVSRGTALIIQRPRSIKKGEEINARDFRAVADVVYAIVKEITTITPEIYKAEKDKAA
jgi:hypothetical protein